MENIFENFSSAFALDVGLFAHLATLGYVLGFLFKNQLILRVLVLLATIFYIIYYYAFPAEPLWGVIIGSVLIMIANIIGTVRLIYDQLPVSIDSELRPVFEQLKGAKPGEFRRLMKIAERRAVDTESVMTEQNKQPAFLFYLINGTADAVKGDNEFSISSGRFIGEVGFILNSHASATVTAQPGCAYLRWERGALNKLLEKNPNLRNAFEALIGRDMAAKVADSQPLYAKEAIAF